MAKSVQASVFIGTSVDGLIARANGAFDFLPAGAVVEHLAGSPDEIVSQLADRGVGHVDVDGGARFRRSCGPD